MTRSVLVLGIGDVGSAVAHALHRAGFKVTIHDVPLPAWTRRKMAFVDAVFDGEEVLEGVRAVQAEGLPALENVLAASSIAVSVLDIEALLEALHPDILIDARMRKRQTPERQIDRVPFTIGVGPNFVAQETTHVVIETAWGDRLGAIITAGTAQAHQGGPRILGGFGAERVVYSPVGGMFESDFAIGDEIGAGEVVAYAGKVALAAPLGGRLRGLTHSGVPVIAGTKVIEIDPRGEQAVFSGIGERPAKIADGVIRAVQAWNLSR